MEMEYRTCKSSLSSCTIDSHFREHNICICIVFNRICIALTPMGFTVKILPEFPDYCFELAEDTISATFSTFRMEFKCLPVCLCLWMCVCVYDMCSWLNLLVLGKLKG